jgi:hypothetical protein
MSTKVSELDVINWKVKEVLDWAMYYGFREEIVLLNIERFNLNGTHLLNGISHQEIGITIPIAISMFGARIEELRTRHMLERSRKIGNRERCHRQ